METKTCTLCLKPKPLSEFSKDKHRKDGLRSRCRACMSVLSRAWREKNKERLAAYNRQYDAENRERILDRYLQRLYSGFTWDDYCDMLVAQAGGCAICGRSPTEEGRRLVVDHNHETGVVRGLLCNKCNRGIGLLQDSPALTRKATVYLETSV